MVKKILNRPTLILVYGFPGAGKTFFSRQLCDEIQAAHIQDDRLRHELFESPRYDKQENEIIQHLMTYMAEEFLRAGISVVFDTNAARLSQRRFLRDFARRLKAQPILIWFQIDPETAFSRVIKRDKRKTDDKYSDPVDRTTFEHIIRNMQNPAVTEDYIVLSGKHTFTTQKHMFMKKIYDLNLISANTASNKVVKPELVNLVPNPQSGRVDQTRRNIVIR